MSKTNTNPILRTLWAALMALSMLALAPSGCDTVYEFDELEVGDVDDTRDPRARENSQFLRAVYTDLLDRIPENYDLAITINGEVIFNFPIDEQEFLLGALSGVGDARPMRAVLTAGLVASEEVAIPSKPDVSDPADYIQDQFRRILGRDASAYELETFVREWQSDPAVNPRTVIRALIGSREYQSY